MTKPDKVLHSVANHGRPPLAFIATILSWAVREDPSVFDYNDNPVDIYASVHEVLGPWRNLDHRRAAMLEVMRVHAAFESEWNWCESVDRTNKSSLADMNGEETGIFQVSFNSTWLKRGAMAPFAKAMGVDTPEKFIPRMKTDQDLALSYYARLIRVSTAWAGPILRHEIHPHLRRDAVDEFEQLILTGWRPSVEDLDHKTIGS